MHFRWNAPAVNEPFLVGEFGRSLRFEGPPEEIERLGRRVAGKMASYLPMLGIDGRTIPAIERAYGQHLSLLNAHFAAHPYLLGGAPTRGDYALMGPLYGHLGRDPIPLRLMQGAAPLVFRWTERINGGELATPEFPDRPRRLAPDDPIPPTLTAWLRHVFDGFADELAQSVALFNAWAAANPDLPAGAYVSPEGADQPSLGPIECDYHGVRVRQQSLGHPLWLFQRVLDTLAAMDPAEREACAGFVRESGAEGVMGLSLARRLTRVNNRLAVE
jgi:glutathione S-transferase